MGNKIETIEEARQLLTQAWGKIYNISKDDPFGSDLDRLRMSINELECRCNDIIDKLKEKA